MQSIIYPFPRVSDSAWANYAICTRNTLDSEVLRVCLKVQDKNGQGQLKDYVEYNGSCFFHC